MARPPLLCEEGNTRHSTLSSIRSVFIDRRFNAKSDFSISRVFANVPAKEVTMCKWIGIFLFLSLTVFAASKNLEIYVIDVEGGNATLFVSPSGESLLIDTGNAGAAAPRDAGRIIEAMKDAGVQQIDHLITTHWHGDHFGGMAELASKVTIREFIDHGPNVQPGPAADEFLKIYPSLYAKAKHTVAKPGDKIPIAGLDVRVVTSAGETIKAPLPGAGAAHPY